MNSIGTGAQMMSPFTTARPSERKPAKLGFARKTLDLNPPLRLTMRQELLGNCHYSQYSVSELADLRAVEVPEPSRHRRHRADPDVHLSEWMGGITSWSLAEGILNNGWTVGADRALKLKDKLTAQLPKIQRRRRKGAWGRKGRLNIERALRGQWDIAYRSHKRQLVAGIAKNITLNVGWGGNCGMTAEQLFWSGTTMLVLAEALTTAGYNVKLAAVAKTASNAVRGKVVVKRIVVKDHGEPLRPDALAGIVCHAGIYRSFGFLASMHSPWDIGSGLGTNITWRDLEAYQGDTGTPEWWEAGIIVKDCYSEHAAIKEIERILAAVAA